MGRNSLAFGGYPGKMNRVMPPPEPVLVSVHIPKCGGTSFRKVLQGIYGEEHVLLNYNENLPVTAGSIPPGTRCIHGHFPARHYDRVLPRFDLVTWLRHPVERVLSNYFQFLRHPDPANPCSEELARRKLSVEAFAELELMRNEATRYLAGRSVAEFRFVGVVEQFDKSLRAFGSTFGVAVPKEPPRENVGPDRSSGSYRLTDLAFARILDLNQADLAAYEQAAARLNGGTAPASAPLP
jgi:hypothetical protein